MGLAIKTYRYSYSRLHRLREAALETEGITIPIMDFYMQNKVTTKYREFIVHSDCDGGYISKTSKQYKKYCKRWNKAYLTLGDLDRLKEEVKELNGLIKTKLDDWNLQAWDEFYNDVMSARKILEFN